MAEAALRSCGAAAGTPQKRSRDPDSSCSEFRTPVSKRLRAFPGSPSQNSHWNSQEKLLASQIQCSPSSQEENQENEIFPRKSAPSRRLDIPEGNLGTPGNPQPGSASSHNSQLPVGTFYGKTTYLDPLERKRLRELLGHGNILEKPGNSGNHGRNSSRNSGNTRRNRSSKGKANPKPRQEIPKGKSSGNVGNSRNSDVGHSQNSKAGNSRNSVLQKRPEFRVLSAGVRPALRLPLGSAFFQSGKRSRKNPGSAAASSGKNPGDSKNPPEKAPEKSGKAEKSGLEEEAGEEEKENRECSAGFGNEGEEEIPRKSVGNSEGAEGKEESPGIPPSPSPDSQNSGPKKELGSPCPAGLFPIFLPTRRRPLEELPAPFGIDPSGKAPRKSKESSQHSLDQMIIDAGQRQLGALQCGSCGMLYAPGIPEDRLQHLRHHRRLREGLRYPGWKKERVVAEFWDGKIVLILPGDPSYAIRKAQQVLALVDSELGFPTGAPRCPEPSQNNSRVSPERSRQNSRIFPEQSHVYLFVSPGNGVLGCLVAQSISQAFRVLPEAGSAPFRGSQEDSQEDSREDSRLDSRRGSRWEAALRAWRCSLQPEPAACGISRLWVLGARRRRGIARRLLDTLRRTFVFGAVLDSGDLAFSDPTPDGRGFAARYCGRADFLVYNLLHGEPGSLGSLGLLGSQPSLSS
ncbi:N-acetyltransferase ESCO2 isoform X2 [Oenanthe melanoleuca]|uniref:N-acetyltransferase ESCO2 isoform X2 n=1 Tax=Oenanthe melanoleuca TaxID=2939378 RepID=UPI0024C1636F|nr:N-acetyltransferase ESCO2 isoform X2 [Oenanthe melanoleuca]